MKPLRSLGRGWLVPLVLFLAASLPKTIGSVLITEFMAANDATLADFEGDYPDWIELYNSGSSTVDLTGWHLTDDNLDLQKWTFPAVSLDPGRFLIVFASNKNLTTPELHTNFRLSAGGEYLALVEPDGVTISSDYGPVYSEQFNDIAYGLAMSSTDTTFVGEGAPARYLVPADGGLGTGWTDAAFADGSWPAGAGGFGYDTTGTLSPFIDTDLQGPLEGVNSGVYLRYPFTLANAPSLSTLQLDLNFDDGFVAYLNGSPITGENAPASPQWNSTATAESAGGLVVNEFAAPEPAYQLFNHSSTPATIVTGSNRHLRLIYDGTTSNHNTIHFDRTDVGPATSLTAEFEFRMNGRADGFSFLMLPTDVYGSTIATPPPTVSPAEEPNVPGVLAIGFDIWNSIDETSIHYGSTRAQNDLSGSVDLNDNVWHRARIEMSPAAGGGAEVSVTVVPDVRGTPGPPVVFHDGVVIGDFVPYEYRVAFTGRTGGATTNVDIDAIAVTRSGAGGAFALTRDLSDQASLLQQGDNVLAIHGMNFAPADEDFLVRPTLGGTTIDSIDPDTQLYFQSPTPGAPNLAGSGGFALPVDISPGGTTFNNSIAVTLSGGSPGGEIRYTTDGSTPTASSPLYSSPLNLGASTRLRARSFAPGLSPGPVRSETFFRLAADLQSFTSDLPIVVVDNFGAGGVPSPGGTFQPMEMAVFDRQAGTGRAALANTPELVTRGGARKRGSSTASQPKPNLRIETWGEVDQEDQSVDLLDFPRESDFILYAPYNFDRALLRNAFMYRLSNELGQYAVRTRFVEVFLNTGGGSLSYSGDYHGVYVLMETIKRDDDRVDITGLDASDNVEPEVTGGYIWKVDRGSPSFSTVGQGDSQVLVDPDPSEASTAQSTWLKNHLDAFGTALNSSSFTDPVTGYAPYLDVPSWVDHHMLNVLAFNVDALRLSTYLHKDRSKPIVKGPVWDFDRSLESYDNRDNNPQTWGDTGGTNFFQRGWFNRLFDDPDFAQRWIDRWSELRRPGGTFSDAELFAVLDEMEAELTEAAARNYARWTSVPPNNGGNLAGEVQNIKDWLALRTAWYDDQLAGAATFSSSGGVVSPGFLLTLTPPPGTVVYYTLDGSDPRGPGGAFAGTLYSGPVTINQSSHVVTRVYEAGNPTSLFDSRWGGPTEAFFLVGSQPASAANLVISEVHYRPADATFLEQLAGFTNRDDFEFLEFYNKGAQPIDLANCRFDDGLAYTFPIGSELAPGERLVLVRDPAAFEARYGNGVPRVFGGYAPRNLGNDGETLRFLDWNGNVLTEFTYNDVWYRPTDGDGWSLELRDEFTPPALLSDAASWAISGDFHGTPGYASSAFGQAYIVWQDSVFTPEESGDSAISGPTIDLDGDGLTNLLEYAFNLDPKTFDTDGFPEGSVTDNKFALTFNRWENAIDLTYSVEASSNLVDWTEISTVVELTNNGDGTETVTITDSQPFGTDPRRFLRVAVTQN